MRAVVRGCEQGACVDVSSVDAAIDAVKRGERQWTVVEADAFALLARMGDAWCDAVVTDPPYDAKTERGVRFKANGATPIGFGSVDGERVAAALALASSRWAVAFCALEQLSDYARGAKKAWVRSGVWHRPDGAPQFTGDRPAQGADGIAIMHRAGGKKRWNGGGGRAVWTFPVERTRTEHPTPKPVPLMLELIRLFTDEGDLVVDPFCGSGTTGIACLRTGRRFIGVEREARYAALARERLAAEVDGSSIHAARAGQAALFGAR